MEECRGSQRQRKGRLRGRRVSAEVGTPTLVGSGVTPENICRDAETDTVIVGAIVKRDRRWRKKREQGGGPAVARVWRGWRGGGCYSGPVGFGVRQGATGIFLADGGVSGVSTAAKGTPPGPEGQRGGWNSNAGGKRSDAREHLPGCGDRHCDRRGNRQAGPPLVEEARAGRWSGRGGGLAGVARRRML